MPTVSDTIKIMKVSQYLASAALARGAFFSAVLDPRLPIMLYVERVPLERVFNNDPNYIDIQQVADYGYALCWPYTAAAENIVNGGGGSGGGGGVTPSQGFPIYITEVNFTTSTFYPNANIFGNNVMIYLNEINRYLNVPSSTSPEFSVSATGITILLDGFDAVTNTYNLVIEKVYT